MGDESRRGTPYTAASESVGTRLGTGDDDQVGVSATSDRFQVKDGRRQQAQWRGRAVWGRRCVGGRIGKTLFVRLSVDLKRSDT
jgi:hypothetical protein